MATVLWGIWVARNMKVWEHKTVTPDLAMQWSIKQIVQWREVQSLKGRNVKGRAQGQQQSAARWIAPDEGQFKINVDASVQAGIQNFSVGMILRDHQGGFYKARVLRYGGEVTVFEAEAGGVLEAVRWAVELGISNVTFESYSMLTVQAIDRSNMNYLEVGNMLQDCRTLLNARPDFSVSYVIKQANTVAHLLARVHCEAYCFYDFSTPPQIVLENLMYDVSLS